MGPSHQHPTETERPPEVNTTEAQICRFLPWDSEFFGLRIARLTSARLSTTSATEALKWCRENAIDCLYFLADTEEMETIRCAEDNGFRLVDMRVTLARKLPPGETFSSAEKGAVHLRPALPADLPALRRIARDSYIYSRFYSDPCFPRHACQKLYETWIENSVMGEAQLVLVAEDLSTGSTSGQPVGFITCHLVDENQGQFGLAGVDPSSRSRGIGSLLTYQALSWLAQNGVERVFLVTQGRNLPAQRMFQRCGFITETVQLWYHRWFTPCPIQEEGS